MCIRDRVRYGDHVLSPVIEQGGADMIVSFELMEALRNITYLKPDGRIVVNNYRINPMPVINGDATYPDTIAQELDKAAKTSFVDAAKAAQELGSPRVMNIVLLGTIVKTMALTDIDWDAIIRENVKPAFVELNIAAIHRGMDMV